MAFYFAQAFAQINWSKGHAFENIVWDRQRILDLFAVLDWMMRLPDL